MLGEEGKVGVGASLGVEYLCVEGCGIVEYECCRGSCLNESVEDSCMIERWTSPSSSPPSPSSPSDVHSRTGSIKRYLMRCLCFS